MTCKFCNKECRNNLSLAAHQRDCKLNPNRKKSNFTNYNKSIEDGTAQRFNQYTKAIKLGLPKPVVSKETREKLSKSSSSRIYTEEQKANLSKSMQLAVLKYPNSYSASNVSGRTKSFDFVDSFGNFTKLKGTWELLVAEWLTSNSIKWTNKINPIKYYWNDSIHQYFPDFYLPEQDMYIEVKGYQRDRDLAKWKAIENKLIIIKQREINQIKQNIFDLIL